MTQGGDLFFGGEAKRRDTSTLLGLGRPFGRRGKEALTASISPQLLGGGSPREGGDAPNCLISVRSIPGDKARDSSKVERGEYPKTFFGGGKQMQLLLFKYD